MKSILECCQPRPDLLIGTFNPEIFTASLGAVMAFYRGQTAAIHSMYANGCATLAAARHHSTWHRPQ